MKDKQEAYQQKLQRVRLICEQLPIENSIIYSLEDLKDAYLETKIQVLKQRSDTIIDKLETITKRDECHYLYRELEDLEEMIYLIEKKFSKKYKKAKKASDVL